MTQHEPLDTQQRLARIHANIKSYPDFPKPGILFRDVFPLFYNPQLLDDVITLMEKQIKSAGHPVDAIVGLESRGFLIGPTLALRLQVPFIPIRKAGKLPGQVKSVSYDLEYGSDQVEIQVNTISQGMNCVIVDDLLATGGSIASATDLIEQCGGHMVLAVVIIELVELKGREKTKKPVVSLVQY